MSHHDLSILPEQNSWHDLIPNPPNIPERLELRSTVFSNQPFCLTHNFQCMELEWSFRSMFKRCQLLSEICNDMDMLVRYF